MGRGDIINPGDRSFFACGILSGELAVFIADLLDGDSESYRHHQPDCPLGGMRVRESVVSMISSLEPYRYFHLEFQDELDARTEQEEKEDNARAMDPEMLCLIMSAFLPDMTPEQQQRLLALLQAARKDGNVIGRTYADGGSDFQFPSYYRHDFTKQHFIFDGDGRVVGYREGEAKGQTVEIPHNITVAEGAFRDCKGISHLIVNFSTVLEPGALAGCSSLEELAFSVARSNIPESLCAGCTRLRKVNLPETVYLIRRNAFAGCVGLEEISVPRKLMFVHETAFEGCDRLPADVREKIRTYSDEVAFRRWAAEAEWYIQTHGEPDFRLTEENYAALPIKLATYRKWHELYDRYFDQPETLPRGDIKYTVYGKVEIDMTGHGWTYQGSLGKKVRVLVVDTQPIPQISRLYSKMLAIADGHLPEDADLYGNSVLDKAVARKKEGDPLLIISLEHLQRCMEASR